MIYHYCLYCKDEWKYKDVYISGSLVREEEISCKEDYKEVMDVFGEVVEHKKFVVVSLNRV